MCPLLDELDARGLLYDTTPRLADRLSKGPLVGYVGFDPTAPSLQIGNLVPVMLLAHLQRAGGTPIVLLGGGTGMIGDPSGKRAERQLLSTAEVDANAQAQRRQLDQFLEFSGITNAAGVLNNADWLRDLNLVEFLRDIGKHFTIASMMQKESVKTRMQTGISFTEFTYMLLQAYDFLHLYRTQGCELQMGGSDQWGNITAGTDLIRRVDQGEAHGLSAPLVTMAGGAKFGKTEEGTVWLDAHRTSAYKFYQYWINVDDRDVAANLKMFTFMPLKDIAAVVSSHQRHPERREAQKALALDLTSRVHGAATAERVRAASSVFFDRSNVETIRAAAPDVWETLVAELPCWRTSADSLPHAVIDLLAAAGLTGSKSEARRYLEQGGIYVNGLRSAPDATVGPEHLLAGRYLWLRRGKKTDVIVRVDG